MSTPYPQASASARKLVQVIMRRLAQVKNLRVAEAIGKDESTISRIASNEAGVRLNDMYAFFDVLGLKLVDSGQISVDRKIYESYKILAAAALNAPETLSFEDIE